MCGCQRTEGLHIIFVETHRNLFGARRANGNIEVFEMPRELLDAVARPEIPLFSVIAELRNSAFLRGYGTHSTPSFVLAPATIAPDLVLIRQPSTDTELHRGIDLGGRLSPSRGGQHERTGGIEVP
jgi:hypothetical protein